jgi:hypothetical protein
VLPDGSILMEPSDAALTAALDRLAPGSGAGPAG